MRIIILSNSAMGLFKFRKELLDELIKQNHEVYVSVPNDEYTTKLEQLGCKYIQTEIDRRGTNPLTDLKLMLTYVKMIFKLRADVVLTYTIKPNVYGGIACGLTKTPYVANITGLGSAVENKGRLQKVTLALYALGLKNASCVFFQNEENFTFVKKHLNIKAKKRLIPGSGVNLRQFRLLDYPDDSTVEFAFISRIMKEKGIDYYLEAAECIRERFPKTVFHVCGYCEESYEPRLKSLEEKGIVKYHGMLEDVREMLARAHCIVHPTYYPEGMSNVLLESAACGRPIITTDRSGCREIVVPGVSGFIVKQNSTRDLVDTIEQFLNLSYAQKVKMGLAGREKVEKEFDRRLVVESYLREIKEALE